MAVLDRLQLLRNVGQFDSVDAGARLPCATLVHCGRRAGGLAVAFVVPCYINREVPFMRATRLASLVVPLLVAPGLAAAQSRSFSYERGIDRPGHAYRVLKTRNAADCSSACQAANSCRAWTYVKPGAPRRAGTASRCWLKHVAPRAIRNDCCISGVRNRSASHVDH